MILTFPKEIHTFSISYEWGWIYLFYAQGRPTYSPCPSVALPPGPVESTNRLCLDTYRFKLRHKMASDEEREAVVLSLAGEELYRGPPSPDAWRSLVSCGYQMTTSGEVMKRTDWINEDTTGAIQGVLQADVLKAAGYTLGRSNGIRFKKAQVLDGESPEFNDKPPPLPDSKASWAKMWQESYTQGYNDGYNWYRIKHIDGYADADALYPPAFPNPYE